MAHHNVVFLSLFRAILTVVNGGQETACELAGGSGHLELADALEALVLFNESPEESITDVETRMSAHSAEFESLTTEQVIELTTQRSNTIADTLHVSSKWALHLLSGCNWNTEQVQICVLNSVDLCMLTPLTPPCFFCFFL